MRQQKFKMADRERDPSCNPVSPLLPEKPPINTKPSAPPGPSQPSHEEMMKFDIVKATQFGVLERCQELIEAGFDVNQMDHENVSLLHWAAINNRIEIVKYYMTKGAIVDRFGGDLNSTPLHWATRQGHLSMVVLLMAYGADPSLRDGEGCSCIHLSSQFAHSSIVAYLIAKGQDVDMADKNGMTALMWSCYRVIGTDPTRLLLTFNASVNKVDKFHKNTALHWACMIGNSSVISQLLDKGINLDAQNDKGETALDIAIAKKNQWLVKKLRSARQRQGYERNHFLMSLTTDKVIRKRVVWTFPFVALFAVGFIWNLDMFPLWARFLIFVAFLALSRTIYNLYYDSLATQIEAPVALYLATEFWMYVNWFVYLWPYVNSFRMIFPFTIVTILLNYNFYKCMKVDPGFLVKDNTEKMKTILEMAEEQTFDLNQFCSTCIIRKPVRSKHCSVCNKCVARFDHHCPWVYNCIGYKNHKYFVLYLTFLMGMLMFCMTGCTLYWEHTVKYDFDEDGLTGVAYKLISANPFVFWIAFNATFHIMWVGTLLACQLYQVLWLGMTTNERMNLGRYKHFHTEDDGYVSPFGDGYGPEDEEAYFKRNSRRRGVIRNCVDLMGWRCAGLCRPDTTDWMTQYELPNAPKTNQPRKRHNFNVARDNYQFV